MKKRWYRSGTIKILMVILAIISLTLSCMSAGASILIMSNGVQPLDSRKYVRSKSFKNTIFNTSHTILDAMKNSEMLDQSADGDLVDLVELKQGNELTHRNTSGLAYKTEDLIDWSQKSWDRSVNVLACTEPDGNEYYMYYADFADKIISGELKFVVSDATEAEASALKTDVLSMLGGEEYAAYDEAYAYNDSGIRRDGIEYVADKDGKVVYTNVCNYESSGDNDAPLKEEYKPDGADSILDIVNNNKEWKGELRKAYRYLYETLVLYQNASDANDTLESYAHGKTNLQYIYVDTKSDNVYSNIKSVTSENYGSVLKKMTEGSDPCMLITPKQQDCEIHDMNMDSQSLAYWQAMIENNGLAGSDYVYFVSVDENFPILDRMAQEKTYYDRYEAWLVPLIVISLAALAVFLFCVVVLTIGAGRQNGDEEVHLNFFDRWYTEVAAVLVIFVGLYGMAVVLNMIGTEILMLWMLIFMGMLGMWFGIWFLIGWLSLVRRIKARLLWKDSLLRHILLRIRKYLRRLGSITEFFRQNLKSRLKTVILFGIFVFAGFIFTGIGVGGSNPVGLLLLLVLDATILFYLLKKSYGRELILEGLEKITGGELQYKIPLEKLAGEQQQIAEHINHIGEGLDAAVEDSLRNERMKTELITNVSHDLKTPLTSIINYVDLLKRENPEDPKIQKYIAVLEEKAQRLKTLTEDVVEASKASTGNISLEMTELNFVELIHQVIGEYEEKFQEKNLTMIVHFDEDEAMICADGRRLWRVLENVFGNVTKYAMENTRVYAEVSVEHPKVKFSLKNISAQPLNITAEELTERFVRGDVSRNTEGSGLGLSIAQSLTELQGGEFKVYVDGDLFKITIIFQMKER